MSRIDDARALLADRLPWLAPAVERLGFTEDPLATCHTVSDGGRITLATRLLPKTKTTPRAENVTLTATAVLAGVYRVLSNRNQPESRTEEDTAASIVCATLATHTRLADGEDTFPTPESATTVEWVLDQPTLRMQFPLQSPEEVDSPQLAAVLRLHPTEIPDWFVTDDEEDDDNDGSGDSGQGASGSGHNDRGGHSTAQPQPRGLTPGELEEIRRQCATRLNNTPIPPRGPGGNPDQIPDRIRAWAGKIRPPQLDASLILPRQTTQGRGYATTNRRRTFKRPNRRFGHLAQTTGLVMPAYTTSTGVISIAIDVSGSMEDDQINQAVSEIAHLASTGAYAITYFSFSDTVHPTCRLFGHQTPVIDRDEGGTDICIAFDKMRDDKTLTNILITDMNVPKWPDENPNPAATWLIVRPRRAKDSPEIPEHPDWVEVADIVA